MNEEEDYQITMTEYILKSDPSSYRDLLEKYSVDADKIESPEHILQATNEVIESDKGDDFVVDLVGMHPDYDAIVEHYQSKKGDDDSQYESSNNLDSFLKRIERGWGSLPSYARLVGYGLLTYFTIKGISSNNNVVVTKS